MQMAKIYSENSINKSEKLSPKSETVKFLLSYSKAYKVLSSGNKKYDMLLN